MINFIDYCTLKSLTMKKQIIATLVAGVLIFLWQFLSWSLLGVHADSMKYTPAQDSILAVLSQHLSEDGTYFLPTVPPGSSQEASQAAMQAAEGKPWATISYHPVMHTGMGLNMLRGFAIDLLAAWLLIWLLLKIPNLTLSTALYASLAVGTIAYLTIPYLNSIWFEGNTFGYLIDLVVMWGVVGLWLGWYLPRK